MRNATIGFVTVLLLLLVGLAAQEVQAQDTQQILYARNGSGCPLTPINFLFPSNDDITTTGTTLVGVTCVSDGNINASGWSTGNSVDTANDPYISFGFTLHSDSSTTIEFDGTNDEVDINGVVRTADGPTTGQFFYSYEGGPVTALGDTFAIALTSNSYERFPPALTVSQGESMEFRFYAWRATNASGEAELNTFDVLADATLPVELVAFDALVDGDDVVLRWETASELNNAGFFVEMAPHDQFTIDEDDLDYRQLGFVEGNGTTAFAQSYAYRVERLDPGRYAFRLKQIDFDGTFEYHPVVEVLVEVPTTHFLSAAYPNPFNPQAQFRLSVAQRQYVKVDLYNALGQMVGVLFEGPMDANVTETLTIDGSTLQSGLYLYRATGESFTESRLVLLVK